MSGINISEPNISEPIISELNTDISSFINGGFEPGWSAKYLIGMCIVILILGILSLFGQKKNKWYS